MMYGRGPILPINTLQQPRTKYVGTTLHRQDLEQVYIVMPEAAKTYMKKRNKQKEYYDR